MNEIAIALEPPLNVRCRRFLVDQIEPGMRVLDVGCGDGDLMRELADQGCRVVGVEVVPSLVGFCRGQGLNVVEGAAERLPFPEESFDAVVCSVVLPYTDERLAIAKWARVLKPGGAANASYHGLGYGLDYLFRNRSWRMNVYGLRMLLNTGCYQATGRRLPGFLGDTLCQTARRLAHYYRDHGFVLQSDEVAGTCCGLPRFLCHRIVKEGAPDCPETG